MKVKKIKVNKNINIFNLRDIHFIAYTLFTMVTLFSASATASTAKITSGMSAEVAAEFTKQLSLVNVQLFPKLSDQLSMVKNPYKKSYKVIKKKLKKEAEKGNRRRARTHNESIIKAKMRRFRECQEKIFLFVGFAGNAKTFSSGKQPLTKELSIKGNIYGVDYPFTQEQANSAAYRPSQIALELGWQYKGRENAEKHVETFFKTCLDIPISVYYVEDKLDNSNW